MEKINLTKDQKQEVINLIKQGNKVEAVSKVQSIAQAGLKNSKDYVDLIETEIK